MWVDFKKKVPTDARIHRIRTDESLAMSGQTSELLSIVQSADAIQIADIQHFQGF